VIGEGNFCESHQSSLTKLLIRFGNCDVDTLRVLKGFRQYGTYAPGAPWKGQRPDIQTVSAICYPCGLVQLCDLRNPLLNCDCSLLRAYALGYLSSVTPKLASYVRRLRTKDWTSQQKLQEVRPVMHFESSLFW
jgi:hypothetical protein